MKHLLLLSSSMVLLLIACSTNSSDLSALDPYFKESTALRSTSFDSVCSFADKFYNFTKSGAYDEDPLYRPIVTNIDSSKVYFLNCGIKIDTTWASGVVINYDQTDEWGQ